jgi:hypothetical protein
MKNGICPKCQSTEIYRREEGGFHIRGSSYGVSVLTYDRLIKLHTYLCMERGYIELYADSKTEDRKAYDRRFIIEKDDSWKRMGDSVVHE